jgi:hypothetical protein
VQCGNRLDTPRRLIAECAHLRRGTVPSRRTAGGRPAHVEEPVAVEPMTRAPTAPATRGFVAALRLEGVHKSFGETIAVAGIDLEIADGEFFSMLSPAS